MERFSWINHASAVEACGPSSCCAIDTLCWSITTKHPARTPALRDKNVTAPSECVGVNHHTAHHHARATHRYFLSLECLAFAGAVLFLMFILRDMLFHGQTMMTHDTVLWVYPIFTYLSDGLLHGHLPLWNPFSRGGEPLLSSYLQTRLFDPIDHLVVYIGALFTNDLTTLFNWDRVSRLLASALGTQLLLRRWAKHPVTRIALAFVSVLSSMTINIFHQCGLIDQFYCAPFVGIFVFRILEGKRGWANWFAGLFFLGPCLQSYFFVGSVTFTLSIILGYALFRRSHLVDLLRDRSTWPKIATSVFFLAVMSGPSLIMFLQQNDFHMSARTYPAVLGKTSENPGNSQDASNDDQVSKTMIMMPYRFIRLTGTPARPADFLGLLAPGANDWKNANGTNPLTRVTNGATMSDSRLFIGSLAFAISLLGISFARHPLKRVWLVVLVGFGLLMLGPYTPFHELLYGIYPPLWVIRHTQQLANFFMLGLLFFFTLGSDYILVMRPPASKPLPDMGQHWWRVRSLASRHRLLAYVLIAVLCSILAYNHEESMAAIKMVSSNSFLLWLAIVAIVYLTLAILDRALTVARPVLVHLPGKGQSPQHAPDGQRQSHLWGFGFNHRFLLYILLAVGCAIMTYNYWESTIGIGDNRISDDIPLGFFGSVIATFAIASLSLAILDYVMTMRRAILRPLHDGELYWWRVSDSYWYSWFRSAVLDNRLVTCMLIAALSAIFIYNRKESIAAFNAFKATFVTLHGNNFGYCVNALAVQAIVQSTLAILISQRFSNAVPRWTIWVARLFALIASIVAMKIFVTLPTPDSGLGYEILPEGASPLPLAASYWTVLTGLVSANLLLAVVSWRRHFFVLLITGMAAVAAMVFAEPEVLIIHLTLFILLPAMCFLLLWRYAFHWSREVVAAVLILVTATELSQLAIEYWPEIQVPRASINKDWPVTVGGQPFPDTRIVTIPEPPFSIDSYQVVRFSEVLARKGSALETPAKYPVEPFVADAAQVLGQPRWNTFFTLTAYRDLVLSGLAPKSIESIFGIGAPIFQFRPNARVSGNAISDLKALKADEALSTLKDTVFLDAATLPAGWRRPAKASDLNEHVKVSLTLLSLGFDQASVVVDSDRAGFVYFADAFTPDWTATINGAAANVLRANAHFKAVQIEPGRSVIHFVYRPWPLIWALRMYFGALSLAAFIALGILAAKAFGRLSQPSRQAER